MSGRRFLVIRLDIDTPLCLHRGVPELIRLANESGVKFTFFANMGRSVSRKDVIRQSFFNAKGCHSQKVNKLSNLEKLGCFGYASVAAFNKQVGLGYPELLSKLDVFGHDIGLHGGENHALWQGYAQTWSSCELSKQVNWGINAFYSVLGYFPSLFSSPGWNSPDLLADILTENGFIGMADSFSSSLNVISKLQGMKNINTNLVGRPGGVGYFEYCKSRGLTEDDIFEAVKLELNARDVNVIYDHPFYLGSKHYEVLRKIIDYALKSNIEVITMKQLLKFYEN